MKEWHDLIINGLGESLELGKALKSYGSWWGLPATHWD